MESALLSQADYALWQASNDNGSISDLDKDTIVSQQLNSAYQQVQDKITILQLHEITLTNELAEVDKDLEELGAELEAYARYDTTLSQDELNADRIQVSKNLISIINQPEINSQKVSPNNTMNLANGLMLDVFVALFRYSWQQG